MGGRKLWRSQGGVGRAVTEKRELRKSIAKSSNKKKTIKTATLKMTQLFTVHVCTCTLYMIFLGLDINYDDIHVHVHV